MSTRTVLAPCPCCGGVNLTPVTSSPPLLAVADYLVERVLAKVGILLTRGGDQPRPARAEAVRLVRAARLDAESAWLVCPATPGVVDRAIAAWSDDWRIVTLMLDTDGALGVSERQVRAVLTDYVHDLVAEQRPHTREGLRLRLQVALGLEVHAATPIAAAV